MYSERICSKRNIRNSLLPHTLKCPSTFNCWYGGCWMCWQYTLTLSLSLVFPSRLSSIFLLTSVTNYDIYKVRTIACKTVFLFKSNLNVFKGVMIIYQEIVAAFTSFINTVKRSRLKLLQILLARCCISLIIWKPPTLLFFKQLTGDLMVL